MKIIETDYSADRLSLGDRFLIGNGVFGYRGTLDEHRKDACVALTTAGFYDRGEGWREPVNMPNPLYTALRVNGKAPADVLSHRECLDISCGIYSRETVYSVDGAHIKIESERFFAQKDYRLLYSKYRVSSDKEVSISVFSGIDFDVWNINGKHFDIDSTRTEPASVFATTNEGKHLSVTLYEKSSFEPSNFHSDGEIVGRRYECELTPEKPFELEKCACLAHDGISLDKDYSCDYESAKGENKAWWDKKWSTSRVIIEGEANIQLALDYSVYQLIIYAPKIDGVSISARGLSGQTYKGAVFWDTEMFMLPFYTVTDKEVARRLVKYRISTLEGAKAKAKHYGFEGAFYAWESHEDGQDACSDFNIIDVFTSRPVRTYFKDKQIHISADIAVAMYKFIKQCNDWTLLDEGALDVLYQCSLFYLSYAYYSPRKDRFELLDVIGPDEYHERVNNNAYTNYMAHETVLNFLDALEHYENLCPEKYRAFIGEHKNDIESLKIFAEKLYLPSPNENGVIEQFDGYFSLEDVSVEEVRGRLVHPQEYWGGTGGVATATRVIKQADVVTLMCVLPHRVDRRIKASNYDFYLPYTEHGSSLSASMYALCACMTGKADASYEWFYKTASIDLVGGGKKYAGKLYIGGTHPASCGGAWLTAVLGYAEYGLPAQIKSIIFNKEN